MKTLKLIIPMLIGILLYILVPSPEGVDPRGWKLLCIFVSTILSIVLKTMPMGAITLIGLLVASHSGAINLKSEALSAFSSPIVWMIVFVLFIARGFIKSQLGTRIAYSFVLIFGKSSLGLGYGLVLSELVIAPFIPSNSARAGGIMLPIINSISKSFSSSPELGTERKIGSLLVQTTFHGNVITSAMFLTAMAANPMCQSIAIKSGLDLSWITWAMASSVPGIISILVIPLIIYKINPPTIKKLPGAQKIAREKLSGMGKLKKEEYITSLTFLMMIILWIFGDNFDIDATTTALMGVSILLLTGVLNWEDALKEKEAWNILIWLSILLLMSGFLEKYNLISWFSSKMSVLVGGFPWYYAFSILALVYFYSHYLFASNTAHVAAMYGSFLSVSILVGTPPMLAALLLTFFSSLFSTMTHYGTTSGSILFSSGYVPIGNWWKIGFVTSIINILIWSVIGSLWWKTLGLW